MAAAGFALFAFGQSSLGQGRPGAAPAARSGAHPAAAHPAAAHPAAGHASASPAPAVQCAEGEHADHGQCCPVGADWVAARHHCLAHNRREALVQVVVTNGTASLPSDLAVTFDGAAAAGTPPTVHARPGAHQIAVNAAGFRAVTQPITLTAAQAERVTITLEALVGRVEVRTGTPGAMITLDGTPLTGTPPARDGVAPGPHAVNVTAEGHEAATRQVTVVAGQTATVDMGDLAALPPPVPVTPEPVASAPPPPEAQTLTIVTSNPEEHFDVRVEVAGHITRCPAPVTASEPCVLHNIPRGQATVGIESPTEFSDNVRVPTGASTLHIEFHRQPALRGLYIGLAIVSLVPSGVMFGVAASCQTECDGLWAGAVGLLVVPGVVPGAFFWASGARTQGSGSLRIEGGASARGAVYDHANDIRVLRAAAPAPPPSTPTLFAF